MLKQHDERIAKILKHAPDLPSLPAAVQGLLQLPEKDATPRDYAEIIGTDQGLTARVLRLVNSAFYSLRAPISSLHHASTMLGTKTLKSMAVSVSVMNVLGRAALDMDLQLFWRHSIAVALASQKLAKQWLPAHEEDLYVAGLLHDAGVTVMAQFLAADYPFVLKLARGGRSLAEVEGEVFGTTHAEVGYTLACRWRLPPLVCDCVRYHELAERALSSLAKETRLSVDLLRLADGWAQRIGLDLLSSSRAVELAIPQWTGADLSSLEGLLYDLPAEVAAREACYFPSSVSVAE